MGQYQSYKDSGTEWLGKIPSHWKVNRIASYFTERKTKVSDKDYAPLSVTKMGILPQLENVAKTDDGDNRKLVKKNDFVINSRSDRRGSSGVSSLDGSVSLINIVLEPKQGISPGYCNYLLKSYAFIEEFYRNGHGIVADLWTTRYDEMKTIKICIPTYQEQERISSYLDAATAKIDEAIAQQQRMINLLNERKKIIINHTVSKGLDPNAKLKDTGIDWMGQIPEHWQICRIKSIGKSEHGISYTPLDMTDESGIIVLRASNIQDGKLCFEDNVFVKRSRVSKFLKKNDILICATNGSLSLVGKNALIDKSDCYSFGTFMLALRTSQNQNFIRHQLGRVVDNYRGLFATTTINQITQQILGNIQITIPPTKEQAQIAIYLDDITSKIDNAISQQTKIINLLQERKQIIINDVVTGKVKVF